jgi:hypothetical protein
MKRMVGIATNGASTSAENRSLRERASGASVSTEMLFDIFPFWVGFVSTLAISFPEPPAGMTESYSASVQPQEGLARMM